MTALRRALVRLRLLAPDGQDRADRILGRRGERAAARHLRGRRYRILGRNVRVPFGEADLVALDPDKRTIVIIEVKTRKVDRLVAPGQRRTTPLPELNVDRDKQRKLRSIARYLAKANRWTSRPIRIDVIAIDWPPQGKPELRHHQGGVFQAS